VPDVLLVDDDDVTRRVLAVALEGDGFRVREAGDGAAALASLQDHAPDCMVLDLRMPGIDGPRVLRTMREQGLAGDTRVLVLTSEAGDTGAGRSWELGVDDVLVKPCDPDRLGERLRRLVAAAPRVLVARREAERQRDDLLERLRQIQTGR
jgi:CheY-like chemotaxis protein